MPEPSKTPLKDFAWIQGNAEGFAVIITDESDANAEMALQGPASAAILGEIAGEAVTMLAYYEFLPKVDMAGQEALISRTGYTGEDGFEIYCRPQAAATLWERLMETGKPHGLQPAGLGCRDTLRFEASMPLYGQELSVDISPLAAGLSRFVKFDKGDFIGRAALLEQKETGLNQKLIGFEMLERGVARGGYSVMVAGEKVGVVTSGTVAPTLGKNLGMALVQPDFATPGQEIAIEIREKAVKARVIARPFYRRGK